MSDSAHNGDPFVWDVAVELHRQVSITQALAEFIESVMRQRCIERRYTTPIYDIMQQIYDDLYNEGLTAIHVLLTGSTYEGMPKHICSDTDYMYNLRCSPVVLD